MVTLKNISGFPTNYVSGLSFDNCPKKIKWKWQHSGGFIDMDGSLSGQAGSTVVPQAGYFPSSCVDSADEFSVSSIKTGFTFENLLGVLP